MRTPHSLLFLAIVVLLSTPFPQGAEAADVEDESHISDPSGAGGSACAAYPTPEDAIRAYLEGVASNQVDAILAATAVAEVREGFRFDLRVDDLNLFLPQDLAPAEYAFYADINAHQKEAEVLKQARTLAYSLLSDVPLDVPATGVDKEWADAFVAGVDPSKLADLVIVEMRFPRLDMEADSKWLEQQAAQARVYGADEGAERVVLLDLEGNLYMVGFNLMRFEGCWRVFAQRSVLSDLDPLGAARRTTAEEFARLTRGE